LILFCAEICYGAGMKTTNNLVGRRLATSLAGVGILFLFGVPAAARASTTEIIYSFGGEEDGEYLDTDVEIDSAGNLYGTSVLGGDFGGGTVWELSPMGTGWVHTVLYSFTGSADGGEPYKGVTLDSAGNLYGTAVTGGSGSCEGGCGVVYKLTNSGGTWTQSVIHAFTGADGSGAGARVTVDRQGNLFGMTPTGGAYGLGTIYQLRPGANGSYSFRVIHDFTGGMDGSSGSAGRMVFRGGHLFGAATTGGLGFGTIFELVPTANGGWRFRTIYSFPGAPGGSFPYGALLFDNQGRIHGTTYYGGTNGIGSIYELTRGGGGTWTGQVIYSFGTGQDGNSPISNLVSDAAGDLYGTTSEGGLGSGTIFELAPNGNGTWTETLPHLFAGPPDGAFPYAGMAGDRSGVFYGATVHGGTAGEGAIYRFTP
jgi:uncharacterized repeat protein (TIGR03803 family)